MAPLKPSQSNDERLSDRRRSERLKCNRQSLRRVVIGKTITGYHLKRVPLTHPINPLTRYWASIVRYISYPHIQAFVYLSRGTGGPSRLKGCGISVDDAGRWTEQMQKGDRHEWHHVYKEKNRHRD